MTTVMPRPFELINWGLQSLSRSIENAQGDVRISRDDLAVFKDFEKSFKETGPNGRVRNQMREAMAQEIRWLHDGRTFPWAPGSSEPSFKYDATETRHLRWAATLQNDYRAIASVLGRADNDLVLSHDEAQNLKALIDGIQVSIKTLVGGVENMREAKNNARPAYEILQTVKNIVNDTSNDVRGGPFGLWTKFTENEAQAFVDTLKWQVTDYNKMKEVVETLFDTAASPYGDIVLTSAAADVFARNYGFEGLDWEKTKNVVKEEHPIVALYAVAIDSEIANGNTNVRDLEVMLNAGRAAVSELGASFATRGPQTLSGEAMPALTAEFTGRENRGRRGELVANLSAANDRLSAYIDQLKAR